MAASATLHPRTQEHVSGGATTVPASSPLPTLLHTPGGLALLELQGTINLGAGAAADSDPDPAGPREPAPGQPIGRLDFPDYDAAQAAAGGGGQAWMRRVYLYVGQHQRLTGEVKALPRPVAIIRRRQRQQKEDDAADGAAGSSDELEVVEIVKYKLVFSQRPEPVGST